MGSPPPLGSKNEVFKLRSVNNIVRAPARIGNDKTNSKVVKNNLHKYNGNRSNLILSLCIFDKVEIKLIEPRIEEAPAKWSLKIAKSTAFLLCPNTLERGG